MRALLLIGLASTAAGCRQRVADEIVLRVEHERTGIENVRVLLDGADAGLTDASGQVHLRTEGRSRMSLILQPVEPDSRFLTEARELVLGRSFFPKPETVVVALSEMNAVAARFSGSPAPVEESAPVASAPEPELKRHRFLESEIPPEPTPTPAAVRMATPAPTAAARLAPQIPSPSASPMAWPTLAPLPPAAMPSPVATAAAAPGGAGRPVPFSHFDVAITQGNSPLGGVQIFALGAGTRVPVLLGSTSPEGRLEASLPRFLRCEALLVRHECCEARIVPTGPKVRVALEPSQGVAFSLQHEAYGIARALPGTEILGAKGRAEVAGATGVAVVSWEALGGGAYRLMNREALPEAVEGTAQPGEMVLRHVALRKAPLASVGLGENAPGEAQDWRKLRREFFARFVQTSSFRPVVPHDVEEMASAVGLSPLNMARKGWEFTAANPELDFLLMLTYHPAPARVEVSLSSRSGNSVFAMTREISGSPELLGGELFDSLLEAFPFEGSVVRVVGNEAVVNLGRRAQRVASGQRFEIFAPPQGKHSLRESAGWVRVKSVADEECTVVWEKGDRDFVVGMQVRRKAEEMVAKGSTPGGL